jgi:hypothetical protein
MKMTETDLLKSYEITFLRKIGALIIQVEENKDWRTKLRLIYSVDSIKYGIRYKIEVTSDKSQTENSFVLIMPSGRLYDLYSFAEKNKYVLNIQNDYFRCREDFFAFLCINYDAILDSLIKYDKLFDEYIL